MTPIIQQDFSGQESSHRRLRAKYIVIQSILMYSERQ